MSSANLAANVTTNTTTTAVAVTSTRGYTLFATWGVGTVTITFEVSWNGTDFVPIAASALTNIASGSISAVYRLTDLPVTHVRLTTSAISGGASVNAGIAW